MNKVKILDIANELGISRNTVAKAINDNGYVAYETRVGILKKALEMGYAKLPPELILKYGISPENSNGNKTILVLNRRDLSPFWNRIIVGINEELSLEGYNVRIEFANEENDEDWNPPANGDISGILVLSVYSDEFMEKYYELNKPIVFFDIGLENNRENMKGDVVLSEGLYAVESIMLHLVSQGMTKIGFIGDTTYCRTVRDRYEGYILGLKLAGLELDRSIMAKDHKPHKYYKTYEVAEALDSFKYLPEAIVCANDNIALDVIYNLKEKGLKVPDDVAVTGYDNLESLVEQLAPFLTTVNVRHLELGKRLARQILWRMANLDAPKEIVMIMGEAIYRKSSKKLKDEEINNEYSEIDMRKYEEHAVAGKKCKK